jgi:hypothetical protein
MTEPILLPVASFTAVQHTDELSEADLEQVVGGLPRVWHVEAAAINGPLPPSLSISPIVTIDTAHRISA